MQNYSARQHFVAGGSKLLNFRRVKSGFITGVLPFALQAGLHCSKLHPWLSKRYIRVSLLLPAEVAQGCAVNEAKDEILSRPSRRALPSPVTFCINLLILIIYSRGGNKWFVIVLYSGWCPEDARGQTPR